MSRNLVCIINDRGEEELVCLEDLDISYIPKPVGGFCYTVENFLDLPLTRMPFYVEDWLPYQGVAEFYAMPKTGKSAFAAQVARCIGAGLPILGKKTQQGRVLYLQFELGEEILQDRLRKTGRSYTNVFVGTTFQMRLDQDGGRALFEQAMDAVLPQVVILDPWSKLISGDENEQKDTRILTNYLDDIRSAYHCSIIVFHHSGKDISKGSRGSSVLPGWVDSEIEMKRVKTNEKGVLRVKWTPKFLRHAPLPDEGIEAQLEAWEFGLIGEPTTTRGKIMQAIAQSAGSVSVKDFVDMGSRSGVNKALGELISMGQIQRLKQGCYALSTTELI